MKITQFIFAYSILCSIPALAMQDTSFSDIPKLKSTDDYTHELPQLTLTLAENLSSNSSSQTPQVKLSDVLTSDDYVTGLVNAHRTGNSEEKVLACCLIRKIGIIDHVDFFLQNTQRWHNLGELNFSYNALKKASLDILFQIPSLKQIDLSHNMIDALDKKDTKAIPSDASIALVHNVITSLTFSKSIADKNNIIIDLTNNPLSCDAQHAITAITEKARQNTTNISISYTESFEKKQSDSERNYYITPENRLYVKALIRSLDRGLVATTSKSSSNSKDEQ